MIVSTGTIISDQSTFYYKSAGGGGGGGGRERLLCALCTLWSWSWDFVKQQERQKFQCQDHRKVIGLRRRRTSTWAAAGESEDGPWPRGPTTLKEEIIKKEIERKWFRCHCPWTIYLLKICCEDQEKQYDLLPPNISRFDRVHFAKTTLLERICCDQQLAIDKNNQVDINPASRWTAWEIELNGGWAGSPL